jgi:hypothetical protein
MADVTISGGDRWKRIFQELSGAADGTRLEIGLLEGSGGGYSEYGGMSTATIGFWHEFGTSRTPPRPFLRKALAEHGDQWCDAAMGYMRAAQSGLVNAPADMLRATMLVVGNRAVSDIKRLFASGQLGPPVTPEREAQKAQAYPQSVGHPLVYSGNLSQAIASEVKTG